MASEDLNRSGALTPEQQGMLNTAVAQAVSESVKGIFAGLLPTLEGMQLTREKLDLLRTPKETDKQVRDKARELRELKKSQADEAEAKAFQDRRRKSCLHSYTNGVTSICLVHNHQDRQPRGVCMQCGDWIHPKEWRIFAGDDEHPNGRAECVAPHKDYMQVVQLENRAQH